ncbi:MAG: alpha/beta fold hydrolase [Roseomonas sp.]|jgi:3-oxoadipate enol-lactonase|nr:alpha/beta fold hydrolase [Roseomonas sp.]MCA3343918.1 alpha/beta fold hydrolase [Roseomonas sp.]
MPETRVNGVKLRYELAGQEGAPLVALSNSLSTDLSMWDPQWSRLTKCWRVLRYDTRGHGLSEVVSSPYTMEQLADDMAGLIEHVGIGPAHIVGLSLGGMTAQVLALRRPELVRSLCLVATTAQPPFHGREIWDERIAHLRAVGHFGKMFSGMMDRWLSMRFRRSNTHGFAQIRRMVMGTPVEGYIGCCEAIAGFDVRAALANITVPTLVIAGEEDSGTTVEDAEDIRVGISGAQLEVIHGARHLLNWCREEEFSGLLETWLSGVGLPPDAQGHSLQS